ncbi:hypothetical protein [Paenibacillus sp. WLX2291]|uniref:hypothetical protein n=1 Tax=Paenibacillus sp. WLX2291 TaxID=3296934 RepID=UPI0039845B97
MKPNLAVRQQVRNEIEKQGYSLSQLSQISGINRGVLSATLGDKPTKAMSINQLDRMTEALCKPLNWLYESFITECLQDNSKMNWRRIRSVLIRCAENNYEQGLHQILSLLPTEPLHLEQLLQLAEFLQTDYKHFVMPIYDFIIKHERNNHCERLAIAKYRIFDSTPDESVEQNARAAFAFKPYCYHLPEHLMLDALSKLASIFYTVRDWDNLLYCGKQSQKLSHLIYERQCALKRKNLPVPSLKAKRPLVVYYGQSYLTQFAVMEWTGRYKEAEVLLTKFSDLSWFEGLDSNSYHEVEKLTVFAKCNFYNLKLLQGDGSILKEYQCYLKKNPDEILASIGVMLKASNIHFYNIDHILKDFENEIFSKDIENWITPQSGNIPSHVRIPVLINRYIRIYYHLAIYYLNRQIHDHKLDKVIIALENSLKNYDSQRAIDCLHLLQKINKFKNKANLVKSEDC